jgi:hypothetical protein
MRWSRPALLLVRMIPRLVRHARFAEAQPAARHERTRPASLIALSGMVSVLVAPSPIGALAFGQSNWHAGMRSA